MNLLSTITSALPSTTTSMPPSASPLPIISSNTSVLDIIHDFFWAPIIIPLGIVIYRFYRSHHLKVKEIKKNLDPDIEGFKTFYNDKIEESIRINPEDILKFVGRQGTSTIEHHLYICKIKDKIVGFIKFMVSKEHKLIFVAYIAIDKNDPVANKQCAIKMIKKMKKKYFKPNIASHIVTEIEEGGPRPYKTSLSQVIHRYSKEFNCYDFYIDSLYIQPQMPGTDTAAVKDKFMSLIYISREALENKIMSKAKFLEIIEFIYFNIYGPSCNSVKDDCTKYNAYLRELLNLCSCTNEDIKLISLGDN